MQLYVPVPGRRYIVFSTVEPPETLNEHGYPFQALYPLNPPAHIYHKSCWTLLNVTLYRTLLFEKQFGGETQECLRSYYSRLLPLLCKIAVHHAVINLKDKVDKEDFEYAYSVVEENCSSVFNMICHITKRAKTVEQTRENIVINLIRAKGGSIATKELVEQLMRLGNMGSWNMAESGTRNFLNSMVKRNIIKQNVEGVPGGGTRGVISLK